MVKQNLLDSYNSFLWNGSDVSLKLTKLFMFHVSTWDLKNLSQMNAKIQGLPDISFSFSYPGHFVSCLDVSYPGRFTHPFSYSSWTYRIQKVVFSTMREW